MYTNIYKIHIKQYEPIEFQNPVFNQIMAFKSIHGQLENNIRARTIVLNKV